MSVNVFPTPFPDELLYSIYARYKRWMGYTADQPVWSDLFGLAQQTVLVLRPKHLDALRSRVPKHWLPHPERLVVQHSVVPYFLAFNTKPLSSKQTDCNSHGHAARSTLIQAEIALKAAGLAYCPVCVVNDEATYGESYWHRSHQLPGVSTCHRHEVFLTRVRLSDERHRLSFVCPPQAKNAIASPSINHQSADHVFSQRFAEDSARVLRLNTDSKRRIQLAEKLKAAIQTEGFVYKQRFTSRHAIEHVLHRTYSAALLHRFSFPEPPRAHTPWSYRFTNPALAVQPWHALLALYALGLDLSDLIERMTPGMGDNDSAPSGNPEELSARARRVLPIERVIGFSLGKPLAWPDEAPEQYPVNDNKTRSLLGSARNVSKVEVELEQIHSWCTKIELSASRLARKPGRITYAALASALSIRYCDLTLLINAHPKIRACVDAVVETPLQYSKRKIAFAIRRLVEEGKTPTVNRIVQAANVHHHYKSLRCYIEETIAGELARRAMTIHHPSNPKERKSET